MARKAVRNLKPSESPLSKRLQDSTFELSALSKKSLERVFEDSGIELTDEFNPEFLKEIKAIELAIAKTRRALTGAGSGGPHHAVGRLGKSTAAQKSRAFGMTFIGALPSPKHSKFAWSIYYFAIFMIQQGAFQGYLSDTDLKKRVAGIKRHILGVSYTGRWDKDRFAFREGVKSEAKFVFSPVPTSDGGKPSSKYRTSSPARKPVKRPSRAYSKIEKSNKKRDIISLNRLLSDVDYEENAKNAKLLIENLANEIFVSTEMRADFSQAAEQFLSDFLARKNEQNPPSIPKKKFKPREISIVAFLKDVWSEWLDRDLLTKQVLNAHDEKAYDALLNWERKNSLADEGLTIRSKSEDNDHFLERENFTKEEAFRVVGALKRRL